MRGNFAARRIGVQEAKAAEFSVWLSKHPELRRLCADLVAATLREKPDDPLRFLAAQTAVYAKLSSSPARN